MLSLCSILFISGCFPIRYAVRPKSLYQRDNIKDYITENIKLSPASRLKYKRDQSTLIFTWDIYQKEPHHNLNYSSELIGFSVALSEHFSPDILKENIEKKRLLGPEIRSLKINLQKPPIKNTFFMIAPVYLCAENIVLGPLKTIKISP